MDPTETLLLRASATLVAMVMPFLWFFVLRWTLSRSTTTTTPMMKSCSLSDFWTTIGLGALCFVLSQAVQLPLAQWLRARVTAVSEDEEDSYREEEYEEDYYNYGPYAAEVGASDNLNNNSSSGLAMLLLLGLWAGLCQEGSRWILFRAWGRLFGPSHSRNDNSLKSKKNQHASSHQALLVGAGHSGCQAFWVALTALVTTLVSIVSKDEESASSQEQDVDPQDVVDQESEIPELLFLRSGQGSWAESSHYHHKDHRHQQLALVLLPLLEQACWMALHMALSLVVWNGIVAVAARRYNNNKISGKGVFTFAVVVHTLVDVAAECTKEAVAEGAVTMLWLLAVVAVPLSFFSLFRLYRVSVEQDNAMYNNNNVGNGLDDYCLEDDDDSDHTWEPHLYHSMDGEEDDHYYHYSDNNSNSSNSEIESDEEQDLFGAGSSTGSVPSLDDEFSLDEAL